MKFLKNVLLLSLVIVLLVSLSACGGSKDTDANASTVTESTSQATVETSDAAGASTTASTASAVPEEVQSTIPGPEASATVDGLLGDWVGVSDTTRTAKIEKKDSAYSYTDNEGTYPATFKDGVLEIKVSDADSAKAYVDAKTGHMFSTYADGYTEFQKK